jgi:hypothetical protein
VDLIDNDLEKTELPFYYTKIFGKELRFALRDCEESIHEVFHNIHFIKLPTREDWDKWGLETNNKVCLEYINPQVQVPSYEKFARDGQKLINFDLPDWYINSLGGKKNLDYEIGRGAYALLQIGVMSAERYNKIRSAILDKYVNKVVL